MAQCEIWFKQDLQEPIVVQQIKGNVFHNDNNSVKLGVELTDGGTAATLSGYSVAGYLIREDGTTMVQTGTISSNKASIIIPNNALVVVGRLDIVLKLTKDSDRISVLACTGYVHRTTTDTIVVPERLVPTLDELLAEVDALSDAVEDFPEDYALIGIGGTAIPANSNLNNYKTPGTYKVTTTDIAGTLSNCPEGFAGTLYVKNSMNSDSANYKQQIYVTLYNRIYTRYTTNGSTWSAWDECILASTIEGLMAIYAPGNTAPQAITKDQFVIWKNQVAKAKSNIASGATLSTSNLTLISNGGLNAVDNKETVTLINSQQANTTTDFASLGLSFTLERKAIVSITMIFQNGRPSAVGCKLNETNESGTFLLTVCDSTIQTASSLITSGFLAAGTYYVWGRTATAGNTKITVSAVYI